MYYVCTITRKAPYYLPGTTEPSTHLDARPLPLFRCQSEGPKYPGANGVNHWWAWLTPPTVMGISTAGWVPVAFLKGVPSDDKPVPGLPLCDGASEHTTESTKKPATESTDSAPANRAPTSTRAPRTKDEGNEA